MPFLGNSDAEFNPQISRYDFDQIIACARSQAVIRPVVVAYDSNVATGYSAGQVLALDTVDGFFHPYKAGGATGSGLGTAVCILLTECYPASGSPISGSATGTVAAAAVFSGNLYYNKIIGLDAAGTTSLLGRQVSDSTGTSLFIF